jgi:hypothetical protein
MMPNNNEENISNEEICETASDKLMDKEIDFYNNLNQKEKLTYFVTRSTTFLSKILCQKIKMIDNNQTLDEDLKKTLCILAEACKISTPNDVNISPSLWKMLLYCSRILQKSPKNLPQSIRNGIKKKQLNQQIEMSEESSLSKKRKQSEISPEVPIVVNNNNMIHNNNNHAIKMINPNDSIQQSLGDSSSNVSIFAKSPFDDNGNDFNQDMESLLEQYPDLMKEQHPDLMKEQPFDESNLSENLLNF